MERKESVVALSNTTFTIPTINGTTTSISVGSGGSGGSGTITSSNSNFTNSRGKAVMTIPYGEDKVVLDETATLEVKGRMVINGIDLEERLSIIEKSLNIPTRDAIMEEKYAKLRELSDRYKQALEEYKTWERLKNSK
jgi:hypothetical protein